MLAKYLLFFVAVVFQSNAADDRDRYFVIDSGLSSGYLYHPNSIRGVAPNPYNLQDLLLKLNSNQAQPERVKIQLYYECLCPDCRDFDSKAFKQTIIALGPYLEINVYPYGNAQTVERNGQVEFICQHGPPECYGNKLHACAIYNLVNITTAVLFNSCMMDYSMPGKGSDDRAADVCAHSMGINSEPIKRCAKGPRGTALLQFYGLESKKANFDSVPHILINGIENSGDDFMRDVCKAFKNPPAACNGLMRNFVF